MPWTVMTVLLGVMAMLGSALSHDDLPRDLHGAVRALFWLIVLALAVASVVLPRKQLTERHIKGSMRVEPSVKKLATRFPSQQPDPALLSEIGALPKNEQRLLYLLRLSMKPMLIGLALSDGIAVVSVIYSIVAQDLFAGLPMLVIAFALNFWHFPRVERLLDRGRKLSQDESVEEFDKEMRQKERALKPRPRKPSRPQG